MSIVALKRNANAKRNLSGKGTTGFSLVGVHRNIGVVGQTNLAKSVTRTPFRGTDPIGHGGNNGSYPVVVSNSGSCCSNDLNIVKNSVKNTSGMIDMKYRWMKRGYPYYWVQDTIVDNYKQSSYIEKVKQLEAGRCGVVISTDAGQLSTCSSGASNNPSLPDAGKGSSCVKWVGSIPRYRTLLAKDPKGAISSSQYTSGGLLKSKCLPAPASKQPFPMTTNNKACFTTYDTWEQAQSAGALPSNFVG